MKPSAGRTSKVTESQQRLIKLEQVRDNTSSLAELIRFAPTDLNLIISGQTASRILHGFVYYT